MPILESIYMCSDFASWKGTEVCRHMKQNGQFCRICQRGDFTLLENMISMG